MRQRYRAYQFGATLTHAWLSHAHFIADVIMKLGSRVVALGLLWSGILGAQSLPSPPGRLVDIGGQRIHLNCTGRGSPTVVFENGAGDFSVVWSLVQPPVSAFTRACSYD